MARRITEADLRKYEFNPARLRHEGGFNEFQLKDACFDAEELRQGINVVSSFFLRFFKT